MLKHRSGKREYIDGLQLSQSELTRNYQEMDLLNNWFGTKASALSALNNIGLHHKKIMENETITIADLGCGSGKLVDDINEWALKHKLKVKLIGIDNSATAINYAKLHYGQYQFIELNLFSPAIGSYKFDIVLLNNICHHFSNQEIIELLRKLIKQTRLAIVINDLHRHWLSYIGAIVITKLCSMSKLSCHDGPLSVANAFRKQELLELLNAAGLSHYSIRRHWLFRWQIIISIQP